MPQATINPGHAPAGDETLGGIHAGISTIAHAASQARLHELVLERARVRLDRAGAHLLTKLQASGTEALRVTDLAERLGVDTPTVTRKLQQLERLGYVRRMDDPTDRRAHRMTLTAAGRRIVERLQAARIAWLGELLGDWSRDDVERFALLLSRFADELRGQLESLHG